MVCFLRIEASNELRHQRVRYGLAGVFVEAIFNFFQMDMKHKYFIEFPFEIIKLLTNILIINIYTAYAIKKII